MPLALPVDHIVSGRYRLASALGHGGMGVVYKAEDLALRRFVALKIIPAETGGGDRPPTDDRERVLREASLTAQINHPNVVTIHDYGCVEAGADSYCYIAMELLSGETLGERLRRQRTGLSRAETILVMTQVVRGLRAAHRRGLVHRDLKPDNIMLTPGDDGDDSVRILDFGLAREMIPGPARGFGDGGDVAGTPEYMSPEQVAGREVDYRADLYAFGILLYECVTGAPPFTGDNPFRVARSHVRDAVPPMRIPGARWRPSLAFQELVRKLLEKRPVARIQTADDLLHRLSDLPEARAVRAVETVQLPTFATRGRYQTHQKLSETPRAIVYEATHDVLGRRVALKVFRSTNPPDPARVLRDLSALALLRHPSNVRVHDAGTTATGPLGLPFVVMERVHGPTLRALLTKERRLSPARAARLIASALDGLAEAHAAGMTHRQLTPDHLLVADCDGPAESAKLIGYRIADRDADRSEPPPPMLQDAAYIAPEVMRDGAPITEQTDLYAAGALLYEAILGRRPPAALMLTSRSDPAPAHLHIPHALVELVHRAVSVDPHDRFESAAAFAAELRAAAGEEGEWAEPERATEPPPHASSTQRSLRSTGAPTLWFLTGDPALARPEVVGVLLRLRDRMRVEAITDDHRAALAARIREEEELPPWVVLFGDTHVLREDPLLDVLARTPEVSRLLVSAELDPEVVQAALNFGGLDHHVALSAAGDDLSPAIDRMVQRAGAARRYYDDLRLLAQRSPSVRHLRLARLG